MKVRSERSSTIRLEVGISLRTWVERISVTPKTSCPRHRTMVTSPARSISSVRELIVASWGTWLLSLFKTQLHGGEWVERVSHRPRCSEYGNQAARAVSLLLATG